MFTQLKTYIRDLFIPKKIPEELWLKVVETTPVLQVLSRTDKNKLRKLTRYFLHKKSISSAQDLELTSYMQVLIAAQACLLILNLSLDYYNGWVQVIVYPDVFKVNHEYTDSAGVLHKTDRVLSGEAWSRGPIVLSWQDVIQDVESPQPGHNVVLHEFAHKLDMLSGSANGMPPLHASMARTKWTEILSVAYQQLNQQLYYKGKSTINSYAATDPAEFFSVITEYFFTAPDILEQECPDVFNQFLSFYRQDIRTRLA
ncbi:MAG: zinc-dependent peptidase [Gammaproteobacteria bacterium]